MLIFTCFSCLFIQMMCTLYTWQYIFFQRSTRFRHFSFRVTVRLWTWTDIAWSSFAAFSLHLSPLPFLPSRSEESCFCLFIRKPRLLSESKHQKGQLRLPLSDSRRLREDINRKKTFSLGHCPNHLTTPPPDPNSGNLVLFFGRQNSRFESHKKKFAKMLGGEGDILTT